MEPPLLACSLPVDSPALSAHRSVFQVRQEIEMHNEQAEAVKRSELTEFYGLHVHNYEADSTRQLHRDPCKLKCFVYALFVYDEQGEGSEDHGRVGGCRGRRGKGRGRREG